MLRLQIYSKFLFCFVFLFCFFLSNNNYYLLLFYDDVYKKMHLSKPQDGFGVISATQNKSDQEADQEVNIISHHSESFEGWDLHFYSKGSVLIRWGCMCGWKKCGGVHVWGP